MNEAALDTIAGLLNKKPETKAPEHDKWAWYHAGHEGWYVGPEGSVGMGGGYMYVEDRNAATPDAVIAAWNVSEGFKSNSSLTVTATAGGDGIRIAGLAAGHDNAPFMGEYTRQAGLEGGKAWYEGGCNGEWAVWYFAGNGYWNVGRRKNVGTNTKGIFGKSTAATPDAVRAGEWQTSEGFQPNSAVRCVRA